jgi:hypothetical protein
MARHQCVKISSEAKIKLKHLLIDWCLTPTLAIFQLNLGKN